MCFAIVKTNELYAMYRKMKPTLSRKKRLRHPDPNGFVAGGLLYFDRDNPAILRAGAKSLSRLNAGNHRLLLAATYLLGLMLLIMWTSKAHAATARNECVRDRSITSALQWSSPQCGIAEEADRPL